MKLKMERISRIQIVSYLVITSNIFKLDSFKLKLLPYIGIAFYCHKILLSPPQSRSHNTSWVAADNAIHFASQVDRAILLNVQWS